MALIEETTPVLLVGLDRRSVVSTQIVIFQMLHKICEWSVLINYWQLYLEKLRCCWSPASFLGHDFGNSRLGENKNSNWVKYVWAHSSVWTIFIGLNYLHWFTYFVSRNKIINPKSDHYVKLLHKFYLYTRISCIMLYVKFTWHFILFGYHFYLWPSTLTLICV